MKLIIAHLEDGERVLVNADNICAVWRDDPECITTIQFAGNADNYLFVTESVNEIFEEIADGGKA